MKKQSNKRRNTKQVTNNSVRNAYLPVLNTNVVVRHKYRFQNTGASASAVITSNNLITAAGVVGTVVNSTVAMIFASVRLRRVEIWGGAATAGTGQTVSIEWTGAANSPNLEFSETTMTAVNPAHLRLAPPKASLASFWQLSTASVNLFQITAPLGSVVDVDLDLIISDTGAAATTLTGLTTVVLNKVYYLALDGINPNNWVPIRLTTTT